MNAAWNTASLIISIVLAVIVGVLAVIARIKYTQLREKLRTQPGKPNNDKTTEGDGESSSGESFWFGLSYSGLAAFTAIFIPLALWFGFRSAISATAETTGAPVMLTLVVIAGVIGLLAVLMMAALAFSAVKLADRTQALGLPEGSVRAVIALSLIVIFVITVVFLFGKLGTRLDQIQHLTFEQANAIPGALVASKRAEDPAVADLQKKADGLKAKALPDAADAADAAKEQALPAAKEQALAAAKEQALAAAKDQALAATKAQDAATAAAKGALYTVERLVEPSRGSEDFAKQVITMISTLVVSISAFYFGSTTAISAAKTAEKTAEKAAAASLTATPSAPVITQDPANLEVHADEPAEFTVTATGSDLTYQWQEQKVTDDAATNIQGATTNTYRIAKVATSGSGTKFSCKITNPAGTVTSGVATLTVTDAGA